MRKGEATRQRILEEATRQASMRGLSGVSLADIAVPSGLSKSGLFKHFESKEDMQRAVIESAYDRFVDYVMAPAMILPPGRPRLEALFDRWLDWGAVECAAGGCPINALAVELDDQPGPLRDYLRQRSLDWRSRVGAEFAILSRRPMPPEEALQAVFEMKAYVLGFSESSRLLEDVAACDQARGAFARLLDRIAASR